MFFMKRYSELQHSLLKISSKNGIYHLNSINLSEILVRALIIIITNTHEFQVQKF